MTSDLDLAAGRELDAKVAEKVFGYVAWTVPRHSGAHAGDVVWLMQPREAILAPPPDLPRYSTDISAAWQVVEYLLALRRAEHQGLSGPPIFRLEGPDSDGEYQAGFVFENTLECGHLSWEGWQGEYASTAPLAICRAALRTSVVASGR